MNTINFSQRKMYRWAKSKALARREFCEVSGLVFLCSHQVIQNSFATFSHRDLLHFILIWRYENNVLDARSWSEMFGVTGQSADSWLLKAERDRQEALRLSIACLGYNTANARSGIKSHRSQIKKE